MVYGAYGNKNEELLQRANYQKMDSTKIQQVILVG